MRQSLSEYDDRDEGFSLVGEHRDDEPAPPRDRRFSKLLLAGGVVALFVGGLWFAYVQGTHRATPNVTMQGDGVPLLRADPSPTKVRPDQPGGMTVPNQNVSLYNDKPAGPTVERLLPPPEKPMPRPAPPIPPPMVPGPPEAATPAPAASPAAASAGDNAAPKPDQKAAAKPPAPDKQAAIAPPKAEAPPAAAKLGGIQVQLGSVRSPEAARDQWAKLKRENGDLLGSLKANAVRTDLGEKGIFYRIEAGPFSESAAAERLCSEMKRRNLGCILVR